jgi:two-component system LytT family sensor kinase
VSNKAIPGLFDKQDLIRRHIIILGMAVIFGFTGSVSLSLALAIKNLIVNFFYIAIIWNGNLFIMALIDHELDWDKQVRLKIIISASVAVLWPSLIYLIFNFLLRPLIYDVWCQLGSRESIIYLIVSIVTTLLINSIFLSIAFFYSWKITIREKEELKRAGISAEFETLKSQINPHFLFNSLNTLTSLIEENPKTATDFVQELSGVYRYVLTQKDKETVTLGEELQFIKSYVYLNEIRFGKNLNVTIDVDPSYYDRKIATLSLQMLVENAIKHNVISVQKPLHIVIGIQDKNVIVKNNLQRKTVMNESHGIGLNNIVHRYSFLSKEEVAITDDTREFMVSIPLL